MIYIKGLGDLFIKVEKRLLYFDFIDIATKSQLKANRRKFAFNHYFYYKYLYCSLLNEYKKRKYINVFEYLFAIIYIQIDRLKQIVKILMNTEEYYSVENPIKEVAKHITLTFGTNRILPKGYSGIYDLRFKEKKFKIKLNEKIKVISLSIKEDIDMIYCMQYQILQKEINSEYFNNKTIILEECMDIKTQIFASVVMEKGMELIVAQRSILYVPLYFHGAKVVCNNLLAYRQFLKTNANVVYGKNFIKSACSCKKNYVVGYLPDIGNFILNKTDKEKLDTFIKKISALYNIKFKVSIHPQELENIESQKYYNEFISKNIILRKEKDIFDFLESIDIVVGWMSTMIYESFVVKKPVIILDLFGDKQANVFLNDNNSHGMVKVVENEKEFVEAINFFDTLSKEDADRRYEDAYKELHIEFEHIAKSA